MFAHPPASRRARPSVGFVTLLVTGIGLIAGDLDSNHAAAETVAGPAHVEIIQSDAGWELHVDGKPLRIKGAGGSASKADLVAAGANSFRTWGVGDETRAVLDEAHELGLKVTVGIWLGHERHGFDYTDADQVAKQFEAVRDAVLAYKDHPALLMWGLGNEMEGFESGDNAAIWSHLQACASLVKKLDPHHPTLTTTAEIGGQRVQNLHRLAPDIDVMGINSYGGSPSIAERYRKAGGTKPYIITEFGPPGTWEVGKNAFGAVEELTSTAKGPVYRKVYDKHMADAELCLGTYAFTWGFKQEATATWFGMFYSDGSKLEAVDAMTEAWSGKPPANRCPRIESLKVQGSQQVEPGATVQAVLAAQDPEGDTLKASWTLRKEVDNYNTGGDFQATPPAFPKAIVSASTAGATLRMPSRPGTYRLFVVLHDGQGSAATANLPLRVSGEIDQSLGMAAPLPFVLEGELEGAPPYAPSGWMGDTDQLEFDPKSTDEPLEGDTCLRFTYRNPGGWVGVTWQSPANDWGDKDGGFDLRGAKHLVFAARTAFGGEKVKFGYGIIGSDKKFPDSSKSELELELTEEWNEYRIDLEGQNLSKIKTGFYWVLGGTGRIVTIYLDKIRYE